MPEPQGPWDEYKPTPGGPPAGPWEAYAARAPAPDSSGFLKNYWEQVNPVNIIRSMGEAALHPVDTLKGIMAENQRLADEATAAAKRGDYKTAIRKGLDYAAQVVPGAGSTLDKASNQAEAGDIAGSAGTSMGLGTVLATAPKVVEGTARAAVAAPEVAAKVRALPGRLAEAAKVPGSSDIAIGATKWGVGAAVPLPVVGPLLREAGRADIRAGMAARRAAITEKLEAAAKTAAAPAGAEAELLDGLSQSLVGKKFADLDPAGQQSVRDLAARGKQRPPEPRSPRAATKPVSAPEGEKPVFEPQPSKYAAQLALRDQILKGTTPPANVAEMAGIRPTPEAATPPPPAAAAEPLPGVQQQPGPATGPAAPSQVELTPLAPTPRSQGKGPTGGQQTIGLGPQSFISASQDARAVDFGKALHESGVDPAEVKHMTSEHWDLTADLVRSMKVDALVAEGVPREIALQRIGPVKPPSKATISLIERELARRQKQLPIRALAGVAPAPAQAQPLEADH